MLMVHVGVKNEGIRERQHGSDVAEDDIRLYIKEVRSGSIIAELVSVAQQYGMISPDGGWVVQFAEYLSEAYSYFKGDAASSIPSFYTTENIPLNDLHPDTVSAKRAMRGDSLCSGMVGINS